MDPMTIIFPALFVALIVLVIVLVMVLMKLMKTLNIANDTIAGLQGKIDPIMDNAKTMTDDLVPTVRKVEPLVDRVQLTLDAVNLEMMRVDGILEDVSQITESAASATSAVDNIANAPVKAVTGVAAKVRERFGTQNASKESVQIADKNAEVDRALEEYKAAEASESSVGKSAADGEAAPAEAAEGDGPSQPQIQFDRVIQELDAATKESAPQE